MALRGGDPCHIPTLFGGERGVRGSGLLPRSRDASRPAVGALLDLAASALNAGGIERSGSKSPLSGSN